MNYLKKFWLKYTENNLNQNHTYISKKAFKTVLNLIKTFKLKSGVLLDIGCHKGILLKNLNYSGEKIGMDISFKVLQHISDNSITRINGDAQQLPFLDNSIDSILCIGLLSSIDDYKSALQEMKRILKPSGIVIIYTFNKKSLVRQLLRILDRKGKYIMLYNIEEISDILKNEFIIKQRIYHFYPLKFYKTNPKNRLLYSIIAPNFCIVAKKRRIK